MAAATKSGQSVGGGVSASIAEHDRETHLVSDSEREGNSDSESEEDSYPESEEDSETEDETPTLGPAPAKHEAINTICQVEPKQPMEPNHSGKQGSGTVDMDRLDGRRTQPNVTLGQRCLLNGQQQINVGTKRKKKKRKRTLFIRLEELRIPYLVAPNKRRKGRTVHGVTKRLGWVRNPATQFIIAYRITPPAKELIEQKCHHRKKGVRCG